MALANTLGVAGYTSGEAYKIGFAYPYTRLQRAFIRQTIDLGGETQKVDAGINQFAGSQTANRLVITVGKFSVADIFDNNKYAHDPRNDFMNWAIVDTGTFDYAAEPWGYTLGAAAEWYQGDWTLRGGLFDLSILPNNLELDPTFDQFQWVGEIERRYELWGHPGKIAVTGFFSRGRMGSFADAIALADITGGPADIAAVRQYQSRGGVSLNLEQEITADLGAFVRAGWANGDIEPYEFTDIDRTAAAGLSLNGKQWGRPDDTVGIAGVVNGISKIHRGISQRRRPWHPRWRQYAAASGAGTNHRELLQLRAIGLDASDRRLSVHRQSRLQRGSRTGERFLRTGSLAVLSRERDTFLLRCMSCLLMLWTAPPPARECQRCGRCLGLPRFGGATHANDFDDWSRHRQVSFSGSRRGCCRSGGYPPAIEASPRSAVL